MNLFEFLMILLSLIVGLGLAEILSGIARILNRDGFRGLTWLSVITSMTILMGLLQTFWESWSLREIEVWSFPAMLLMLGTPTFLFLIAHVLFPSRESTGPYDEHYFERKMTLWTLAACAALIGTLFRPLAFGLPLWVIENVSAIPTLIVCALLANSESRRLHQLLLPIVFVAVLLDTLAVSYTIT